MEFDAALIMALSVLVWRSGRVGPWVLLIGLMRDGFVAAGWLWPALNRELPPSLRRKVGAVVQGIVLLVAVGPIIPAGMAVAASAAGLALLSYSFVAGDHQAAPWVTGATGADVPVHVIARDEALLEPFLDWGFQRGPFPASGGITHRMDAFRERFVRGFSAQGPGAAG